MQIGKNWLIFVGNPSADSTIKITHFGPFGFEKNEMKLGKWLEGQSKVVTYGEKWAEANREGQATVAAYSAQVIESNANENLLPLMMGLATAIAIGVIFYKLGFF